MSTPPVNINSNSLLQESSLSKMRRASQQQSLGFNNFNSNTGKSFRQLDEGSNVFQSGNFSAKYFKRNSAVSSTPLGQSTHQQQRQQRQQQHHQPLNTLSDSINTATSITTSDVDSSDPVTIMGGFSEFVDNNDINDDDRLQTHSDLNISSSLTSSLVVGSTPKQPNKKRRQSILSNLISSSVSATNTLSNTKLPNYSNTTITDNPELAERSSSGEKVRSNNSTALTLQKTNPEIDLENPDPQVVEIIERHLSSVPAQQTNTEGKKQQELPSGYNSPAGGDFDSLKLQSGDITRGLYNWVNEQKDSGSRNGSSPLRRVASSGSISTVSRIRRGSDIHTGGSNDDELMNVSELQMPGGFRRSFIAKKHRDSQLEEIRSQLNEETVDSGLVQNHRSSRQPRKLKQKTRLTNPNFFTNNFIEFLTLYGHFAGEDLREENSNEDDLDDLDNYSTLIDDDEESSIVNSEFASSDSEYASETEDEQPLAEDLYPIPSPSKQDLRGRRGRLSNISFGSPSTNYNNNSNASNNLTPNLQYQLMSGSKRMLQKHKKLNKLKKSSKSATMKTSPSSNKKISSSKAFFLLLKAFVGTGVVFLPKSFSNGGLLFCNIMIVLFSIMSFYCFIILVKSTSAANVLGYADVGLKIFGPVFQFLILVSLALSQLGFASTYVVFVAENLKQLMNTITGSDYGIALFMGIQLIVFLPLSLTRNIGRLSFTALIADFFILLGLIYIYACSSSHLIINGVAPKLSMFKSDTWTLFIGTAVFSYEGVGLLIPIQESMKKPEDFNKLLLAVMSTVTVIFVTLSSICYMSYGDDVETVILMNFPRNALALVIQLCYALAILLSTPLQLFPAIKIFENYLFHQNRQPWKNKIRRESEVRSLLSSHDSLNDNIVSSSASIQSLRDFGSTNNKNNAVSNKDQLKPLPPLEPQLTQEGIMSGKSDHSIKWLKNIIRIAVVLLMTLAGYLGSSDLDRFVSIIGSFTCVPLIYIYPPLLYLKSFNSEMGIGAKCLNIFIFAVGCSLMAYTSYQTISTWSV